MSRDRTPSPHSPARRALRAAARPALALCLVARAAAALAQGIEIHPAVDATVSANDNANGAPRGEERKDVIAWMRPTVAIDGQSRLYKIHALVGGELIGYANGTQPNRAFPLLLVDGTGTLVERLLFLDASTSVRAAERDPYAARSEIGSTQNREVTSVYRLSPYVNWDISPNSNLYARFEEVVSRGDAGSATNQDYTNIDLRLATRPQPYGGSVAVASHAVRYTVPTDSTVRIDTIKASGDIAVGGEFVVGPSIGTERTTFESERQTDTYYGAHVSWNPDERTQAAAEVEKRFFGTGWKLELRHRAPYATAVLAWERAPVTTSQSLGVVTSGAAGLNTFLDAILTTRYPDPAARAAVVSNVISNRGLQNDTQGAIDVRANYAQLQNNFSANVVFLGTRNVVTVGVYVLTLRGLTRDGDALASALPSLSDNKQVGANLEFNRKLTPLLTADLTSTWSRITGLGDAAGQKTTQQSHRLSLVRALSPRTNVSIGVRRDVLNSHLTVVQSYVADSVFVGVNHKF